MKLSISDKQVKRISSRLTKKAQIDDRLMEVRDKLVALVEAYDHNYPEAGHDTTRQDGIVYGLQIAIRYIEEMA